MALPQELIRYLPREWFDGLQRLSEEEQDSLREIRLRAEQPFLLSTAKGNRYLGREGLSSLPKPDTFTVSRQKVNDCFLALCEGSLYAHEEELRRGFLSADGGIRVGVAGRCVCKNGALSTLTDIRSLCFRLPGKHEGCGDFLLPVLLGEDGFHNTLLVGEPSSGKTTLLRDVAVKLAQKGLAVCVIDERQELGGTGVLSGCDVYTGIPKARGMELAVRSMAPEVLVVDELGSREEAQEILRCTYWGVGVLASLHGSSPRFMEKKAFIRQMIEEKAFEEWVFLQGRRFPGKGKWRAHPEVNNGAVDWGIVGIDGGSRMGTNGFRQLKKTGAMPGSNGAGVVLSASPPGINR